MAGSPKKASPKKASPKKASPVKGGKAMKSSPKKAAPAKKKGRKPASAPKRRRNNKDHGEPPLCAFSYVSVQIKLPEDEYNITKSGDFITVITVWRFLISKFGKYTAIPNTAAIAKFGDFPNCFIISLPRLL